MHSHKPRSIAVGIVTVACACVSIILCITILSVEVMVRDVLREDLGNRTQQTLNYNYQLVRFQVNRARLSLNALASDKDVIAAFAAEDDAVAHTRVVEKLDNAMALVKFLENIALQRPTCEVIVADSNYARESVIDFFTSDYCRGYGHEGSSYVSGLFTSATTERSVMVITLAVMDDAGQQVGQISAMIDVGDLSLYLSNLQENEGFTIVLDRYGNAVVDTRQTSDEQGVAPAFADPLVTRVVTNVASGVYSGFFEDIERATDVIVGFHQYAADPGAFTVINVAPRSLSYQLERKIIIILSSVGGLMIVALVLALWVAVRWSTRRLNRMTETIRRIVKGDESDRLPDEMFASEDEVGTLGQSFNHMIERIHDTQSALEDARAKSEAILLGIGDGVMAVDVQEKIIVFNQAAEHISGFSAAAVMGKPYRDVMQFVRGEGDATQVEDGFIRQALGGSLAVMPEGVFLVRNDGIRVPVADSSGPVVNSDGRVIGAVVVFRDVTHEREVDRLKSEFVSVASHQLRTPLTAIRWYLEDLQSEEIGALNQEQEENVTQAVASTGRMIRLVNDLLDVSRLESGRLSIHPQLTDIGSMLQEVVTEYGHAAVEKHCTITLHLPESPLPPIAVDTMLIRQVATNLISNAIKYGRASTSNTAVDVTLSKDGEAYYRVTVRDNGMGIATKDEERIFHRFFRADNALKQQTEGSGLGLYIAKLIIEASGGMIAFSSIEGRGSTFWFLLPIAGSKEHRGEKSLTSVEPTS